MTPLHEVHWCLQIAASKDGAASAHVDADENTPACNVVSIHATGCRPRTIAPSPAWQRASGAAAVPPPAPEIGARHKGRPPEIAQDFVQHRNEPHTSPSCSVAGVSTERSEAGVPAALMNACAISGSKVSMVGLPRMGKRFNGAPALVRRTAPMCAPILNPIAGVLKEACEPGVQQAPVCAVGPCSPAGRQHSTEVGDVPGQLLQRKAGSANQGGPLHRELSMQPLAGQAGAAGQGCSIYRKVSKRKFVSPRLEN
jgi:hypothetical protein